MNKCCFHKFGKRATDKKRLKTSVVTLFITKYNAAVAARMTTTNNMSDHISFFSILKN